MLGLGCLELYGLLGADLKVEGASPAKACVCFWFELVCLFVESWCFGMVGLGFLSVVGHITFV